MKHVDLSTERFVLGAMIEEPQVFLPFVTSLYAEDFWSPDHRELFDIIRDFQQRGAFDHRLVQAEWSRQRGGLDSDQVNEPLACVAEYGMAAPLLPEKIKRLLELSQYRTIEQHAFALLKACDTEQPMDDLMRTAKDIAAVPLERQTSSVKSAPELFLSGIDYLQARMESGDEYEGLPSGFPNFDQITGGFRRGELAIIGARPSVGKSAFAMSLAIKMGWERPVGFVSLEMTMDMVARRLVANLGNVDSHTMTRPKLLKHGMFSQLLAAADKANALKLFCASPRGRSLASVLNSVATLVHRSGAEIVFVDYGGMIQAPNARDQRYRQVQEVNQSLKQLAVDLNIPIVLLAQVGREAEGGEPSLKHLKESGSYEEDADLVVLIHRDREAENQQTLFKVAKNRNGQLGRFSLHFDSGRMTFEDRTVAVDF